MAVADPAAVARPAREPPQNSVRVADTAFSVGTVRSGGPRIAASIASRGLSFRMRATGGVNDAESRGWKRTLAGRRVVARAAASSAASVRQRQIRRNVAPGDRDDAEIWRGVSFDSGCNQDQHNRGGVQQSGNQSGTFRRCVHERLTCAGSANADV